MELIQSIIDWYLANINYFTITLLMVVESSFIPFPSEVVVPVAAWKACQGELNIFIVLILSTLGALIGACINYFLSITLGRTLIYKFADTRFAHACLIDKEKVEKSEAYFRKNGNISTFVGRFIPGIRQLISIPAGLAKMKFGPFCLYTSLGAFLWNVILAVLGYVAHGQMNIIKKYNTELAYIVVALSILFVVYLVYKGVKKN
ncbi:MAG: DedA family protein [Bacteroidales bacterium]|jgi:membrane protein DedA with SNARE-associated domain|nr:DedA family protein [Bacteroidales bacterium]